MKKMISLLSCVMLLWLSFFPVSAAGEADSLACPVLPKADTETAARNIAPSIVTVLNITNDMFETRGAGSGVILSIDDARIVILTAAHVVKNALKPNGSDYYIYFADPDHKPNLWTADPERGYHTPADLLYYSSDHDIAFLTVDTDQLDPAVLSTLRYVQLDGSAYEDLQPGDPAFTYALRYSRRAVNPNQTKEYLDPWLCKGAIADLWGYSPYADADDQLQITYSIAPVRGMSGGGTFDGKGRLIGIISNSMPPDGYSVPLPVVIKEYEKVKEMLKESED